MKTFKEFVVQEDNTAGAGGVFGDAGSMGYGGAVGNTDFYAPTDSRIPSILGAKKVVKGKGKNKSKKLKIPIQTRTFTYF